jgi:histidinol-phosphate/aromatic aminotransferase/cobyric acid decarboxylase-like protein
VIKSLSKSLGVPGLRIGYLYSCNHDVLGYFNDRIPVWNSNSIAEYLLEIILKFRNDLAASIRNTKRDREHFRALLQSVPYVEKAYPSGGNFILAQLRPGKGKAADIAGAMLSRHEMFIKDISAKFSTGRSYLRFAVRLPHENALLTERLASLEVA